MDAPVENPGDCGSKPGVPGVDATPGVPAAGEASAGEYTPPPAPPPAAVPGVPPSSPGVVPSPTPYGVGAPRNAGVPALYAPPGGPAEHLALVCHCNKRPSNVHSSSNLCGQDGSSKPSRCRDLAQPCLPAVDSTPAPGQAALSFDRSSVGGSAPGSCPRSAPPRVRAAVSAIAQ